MLNCVFWNTFYIGFEKTDIESHIEHQFLKESMLNVITTSFLDKTDVESAFTTSVISQNLCYKETYYIGFRPTDVVFCKSF